ncbi:hypothetical protein O3V59_19545, partial [Brevibacillus thermoruber]
LTNKKSPGGSILNRRWWVKIKSALTTDDRMYVIKISEDQKQFLYVSPRKEEKAKIVALDKDGNMIYQQ